MVIAALVLVWIEKIAILGWILNLTGFIVSIVANSQIKKSMGRLTGKGWAVAGIVLSCVLFGLFLIIVIAAGALIGSILGGMGGF